ncbi:MAG: hypothetical protein HOC91_13440 [Nitrospinaceae bacterium]|jgi:hypothetical protein|nr:hypothetical protein [Nitrospinaceae bacterium]MBT3433668.1 hypothetical protein [Nitrospinaceae bacterium]MBT3819982.1 hypothetical protein [Nitrospinaceae bacterium]MBT4093014.1 hypothetical protein [Nitrospinaceae bacterium]MBT4431511.1 hypothetical protein [Nitrospinaceae bacterium]
MAEDSIPEKLIQAVAVDLDCYERLLVICGCEFASMTGHDMDELPGILEEKGALIKEIQSNSSDCAPLWAEMDSWLGDEFLLKRLGDAVQKVREAVLMVQQSETRLAALVATRSKEVREALGIISKSGKALDAYKPTMTYSPRFIDRKE